MSNKRVYEIDLEVSGLINNYKKALQVMKSSGASDKTLAPLEKSLSSIEAELLRLQKAGRDGIVGDPSALKAYEREVQNAYKKLEKLGDTFSVLASDGKKFNEATKLAEKNLKDIKKQSTQAQKALAKTFENLGFDKERAETLSDEIKNQTQLNKLLKDERALRKEIRKEAKDAYDASVESYSRQAAARFGSNFIGPTTKSAATVTPAATAAINEYAESHGKSATEIYQRMNRQLANMVAQGEDFQTIWAKIEEFSQRYFNNLNTQQIFGNHATVVGKIETALAGRQSTIDRSAEAKDLKEAQSRVDVLKTTDGGTDEIKAAKAALKEYLQSVKDVRKAEEEKTKAEEQDAQQAQNLKNVTDQLSSGVRQNAQTHKDQTSALIETAKTAKQTSESFSQLKSHILMFFSVTSVISIFRQQIRATFEDVKNLDKSFASIAMVTTKSVNEMWDQYSQYADMASELGQRTQSVIDASALFYQQGLEVNEALELTGDTMRLATLAGIDYAQATDEMTAAIRGFRMEMDEGARVTDVYSTLAANAAASVNDIAQAMVRTSSIANSAGMSFENTAAFLTQMIETTQESAENIGTSMKTIIARFTELKENVAGTDESEFEDLDLNNVDKALKSVGVALKDSTGQFRDLDTVFMELSSIWGDLDRNTQRYVATIAAGSRQQSRFLALMDGYERNVELMNIAADSTGQAQKQFDKYRDTMEFSLNKLATQWEELRISMLNEDDFKKLTKIGSDLLDKALDLDPKKAMLMAPIAMLAAGTFVKVFIENLKTSFEQSQSTLAAIGQSISGKIATRVGQTGEFSFYTHAKNKDAEKIARKQKTYDVTMDYAIDNVANLKKESEQNRILAQQREQELNILRNKKQQAESILNTEKQEVAAARTAGIAEETLSGRITSINTQKQNIATIDEEILQKENELNILNQQYLEKEEQITQEIETKRNQLYEIQTEIDGISDKTHRVAQMIDNSGGISTALTGFGQGLQQASGSLVMMATMAISGAKATDTLKTGFVSLAALGMSQVIPTIQGIIKAQQAYNAATKNSIISTELANGLSMKEVAAKTATAAATGEDTAMIEANTVAQTANNAAKAAALSLYALLAVAVLAAAAGIAYLVIKMKEQARQDAINQTAIGASLSEIERLGNELKTVAENLEELSQKVNEAKEEYDLFAEAQENYKDKIYLTEEEQAKWLDIQEKIAEQHPELIASYDEEGTAILDLASVWEQAAIAKRDYYEASLEESKEAYRGVQLEISQAKEETGIIEDAGKALQGVMAFAEVALKYSDSYNESTLKTAYSFSSADVDEEGRIILSDAITNRTYGSGNYTNVEVGTVGSLLRSLKELSNTDTTLYTEYMTLIKEAFVRTNADGFEELTDADDIFDKLWEESKDPKWMEHYWSEAWGLINEDFYNSVLLSSQGAQKASENKLPSATRKLVADTIRNNDNDFTDEDLAVQNLLVQQVLDSLGDVSALSNQEIIDQVMGILQNSNLKYSKDQTKKLKEAQDKYKDDVLAQYEYLASVLPAGDQLLKDFRSYYDTQFQNREDAANDFAQLLFGKYDGIAEPETDENGIETGQFKFWKEGEGYVENDITELYNHLGMAARLAFAEGYQGLIDNEEIGKEDAQDYYNGFAEAALKLTDDQDTLDYIVANFDPSAINDLNYQTERATFGANVADFNPEISRQEAEALFDELYNQAKSNIAPIFTEVTEASYRAAIEGVEQIEEVLSSHTKVLQKYAGYAKDGVITISKSAGEEVEKLIKDLYDPKKGGLSKSLFENILDLNEETGQYTYDIARFMEIIQTYGIDILDSAEATNYFTGSELSHIKALNNELKISVGLVRSIEDTISGFENLTSSFTSAAQDQIKNGYVSAKNIQSLLDNTKSLGLDANKMAGFFNDSLQFDYEGAYAYIDAQIKILESDSKMAKANKEQIVVWQALKKELMLAKNELEEEAKSTNKAEEAQKKYEDQLKTVEEKQRALNEALREFNEFMYGESNRESGLDKLYNYEQHLEHFNNEISRSKDILSDAETLEEATAALDRYSSATHDAIRYEKARAEAIREGLAAQEAQLNNFTYSYSNPEGGPVANIRFSDYIRKDSTGLYSIDQTLVDRAQFNDKFKQLLEQQVDDYNKYAEELLKSEDNVRKMEKEFQEQRAAAVKAYASMEKNIADALKNNYQEEVDALKEKYDSMKEADDDYLDALSDAIEKQRKLREKESKYTDLSKKEKKLSLISRDTSGAQELQRRQLEQEIEKDRESLLDEAIDEVIDGMKELYEQQEENREVEIELKEALLENTGFWYSQAEGFAASFETAEDYMEFMARLDKEFAESTLAMREDQLNAWRDEYQGAIQYTAMQAMDATSETGDFIVDTINITGEEVKATVAETSDAYASEVITTYNKVTEEFQLDMQKQVQSIQSARDALSEAITKLQEYAAEARKAAEAFNLKPGGVEGGGDSNYVPNPIEDSPLPTDVALQKEALKGAGLLDNVEFTTPDGQARLTEIAEKLGMQIIEGHPVSKMQFENWLFANYSKDSLMAAATALGLTFPTGANPTIEFLKNAIHTKLTAFENGGIVDYTGPAWVDGTKSAPEAFLNPEDTRRIGEAARILADLPIFNSYGETTENISNSSGDISIEINLNIDKISSETDIDEMLDRVKEEIVSTARSVGTNTILQQ